MEELSVPSVISDAERSMELARIWLADNKPTFVLSGNLWETPAMWGLLLVDFMNHIASAYAEQGSDRQTVRESILEAFSVELENTTDCNDKNDTQRRN